MLYAILVGGVLMTVLGGGSVTDVLHFLFNFGWYGVIFSIVRYVWRRITHKQDEKEPVIGVARDRGLWALAGILSLIVVFSVSIG